MRIPDEFIEETANLYRIKKDSAKKYNTHKLKIEGGISSDMLKWLLNTHSTFENFLLYKWGMR